DVSGVADGEETVYLRWTMGETDLTAHYCGWNIDDVEILAYDLVPPDIEEPVTELKLSPARPNPFHDETRIVFELPSDGGATVSVYDVAGRLIRTLPESSGFAGPNLRTWDGTDADGNDMPSGVYFVRVTAGGESATGKVVLVR
ncbi:T9SS type A sorting domain-containing protein, partial [bacterium]|nr:T9SS type A sorting domain-containing protein [bacterium]